MKLLKLSAFAAAMSCASISNAQTETVKTPDNKLFEHHIGVQVNELVKQVFNFNNNSSTVKNPYLLTYNINFKKSGWGLRIGAGYNKQQFNTDDGITKRATDVNTLNARLGFEKAFRLSGRWTAGIGADGVYGNDANNTSSTIRSTDSTKTVSKSTTSSYGGGAMGWLRYAISNNVVIGTETSFYFTESKEKQDVTITQYNRFGSIGQPVATTNTSKVDDKQSEMVFSLPVVLYLYIKF